MKPPLHVFGWPSRLGGADTKLADLLGLLSPVYAITCVPNDTAQLSDSHWTRQLSASGVNAVSFDALPPRLSGVGLAICNDTFFTSGRARQVKARGLSIVWSSEMMWHHEGELEAVRDGVVDRVLYVSDVQRRTLEPGYLGASPGGVSSTTIGNYIDPDGFPFCTRRRSGFVIGRLSRPDPLKYPEDFPVFYERLQVPAARFRVMAWNDRLAAKYRWHQFDARWDLLSAGAEGAAGFLHSLDCFVYPLGHQFRESWGRSTVEAMLTGCVPIVPAGDHLEAIVEDGVSGFVCRDFDEWRDRTQELSVDPDRRGRMGHDAREHALEIACRREAHQTMWQAALQ